MTRLEYGFSSQCWLFAAIVTAVLSGCSLVSNVPKQMQVREGTNPKYQDEDVRFRTTYYFRAFDFCDLHKSKGSEQPEPARKRILHDSLYRFRMTGKANPLFVRVHFESGSLKSYQIDPFGASVTYNARDNRFEFKSQQKRDEEIYHAEIYAEIDKLLSHYKQIDEGTLHDAGKELVLSDIIEKVRANIAKLGPSVTSVAGKEFVKKITQLVTALGEIPDAKTTDKPELQAINQKIRDLNSTVTGIGSTLDVTPVIAKIDTIAAEIKALPEASKEVVKEEVTALSRAINDAKNIFLTLGSLLGAAATDVQQSVACGNGLPTKRGFQILGPEGWRTFDQDERLMMVMATTSKPIIDTLRELSDRVLQQEGGSTQNSDALLRERLLIFQTRRGIEQGGETLSARELIDTTVKQLDSVGKQL